MHAKFQGYWTSASQTRGGGGVFWDALFLVKLVNLLYLLEPGPFYLTCFIVNISTWKFLQLFSFQSPIAAVAVLEYF